MTLPKTGDQVKVVHLDPERGSIPAVEYGALGVELDADGNAVGIVVETDGGAAFIDPANVISVERDGATAVSTAAFPDGDRRIGVEYAEGEAVEVLEGGTNTWAPAAIESVEPWGFSLRRPDGTVRLAHLYQVRKPRR